MILALLILLNKPSTSYMPDVFVSDTTGLTYLYPEKDTIVKKEDHNSRKPKIQYKYFNPNDYVVNDWIKLGFSKKQSKVIVDYKNRIDGFDSFEDIESCYVISAKKAKELEPYLVFVMSKKNKVEKEKPQLLVELNQSTEIELKTVNGIGSYFAEKIIERRNELGGFYKKEQIKEVYGMSLDKFDRIEKQVMVIQALITPLLISNSDFKTLKRHPYLNWKQSQIIVALENKIVNQVFWDTLLTYEAFTETDINKLKPYLK